jgi:uncharacterized membrane protein
MRAIIFAVLAGLCWGVGEIFTKWAINTGRVGPFTVLFLRACVTVVPALIACFIATRIAKTEPAEWWKTMTPSVWAMVIGGSGLLAGFLGVFFFYWGLGSPGGDISIIRPIAFALSPATAVLLGWLVLDEGMTVRKAISVVLIVVGIALLAGEKSKHGKPGAKANPPATAEAAA